MDVSLIMMVKLSLFNDALQDTQQFASGVRDFG